MVHWISQHFLDQALHTFFGGKHKSISLSRDSVCRFLTSIVELAAPNPFILGYCCYGRPSFSHPRLSITVLFVQSWKANQQPDRMKWPFSLTPLARAPSGRSAWARWTQSNFTRILSFSGRRGVPWQQSERFLSLFCQFDCLTVVIYFWCHNASHPGHLPMPQGVLFRNLIKLEFCGSHWLPELHCPEFAVRFKSLASVCNGGNSANRA